jgi:hypothetical protein
MIDSCLKTAEERKRREGIDERAAEGTAAAGERVRAELQTTPLEHNNNSQIDKHHPTHPPMSEVLSSRVSLST